MENIYSDKVYNLVNRINEILLIPDLIMVREGHACGDKLVLSGEVDDDLFLFHFYSSDSCILSQAVCQYLEEKFQGKRIYDTLDQLSKLERFYRDNPISLFELFDLNYSQLSHRYECLLSPFRLLVSFIEELCNTTYEYSDKPDTLSSMECDACVSACRINWGHKSITKKDHHGNRKYTPEYLKQWLPLGKIELNKDDILQLRKVCSAMTPEDYQFLSDHTINSVVLYHLYNYAPELINDSWKGAAYLIQKKEITLPHFEKIKEYILRNNLEVYFVKGYVSQKYYKYPALRIHSDYDIIASNEDDAFQLANWLLQHDFTIRPSLFSYKTMHNENKEYISGHFHVQKIIDDLYMFELDITFPGFPINRVELFFPHVVDSSICTEDQVVITLLHLFKHSNIYMKDLNDLYYMLQEKSLDNKYLKKNINKYKLHEYFNLAVSFIISSYPNADLKLKMIIEDFDIDLKILQKYPDWPYDMHSHLEIKEKDYSMRVLSSKDNHREFLFPIAIFKSRLNMQLIVELNDDSYIISAISDNIYKIRHEQYVFHCTSLGVFIGNYIDTNTIERKRFVTIIAEFLKKIGNPELLPIPYATEHFYVRTV